MFEDRLVVPQGLRTPGELTAAIACRSEHLWFPIRPGSLLTLTVIAPAIASDALVMATQPRRITAAVVERRWARFMSRASYGDWKRTGAALNSGVAQQPAGEETPSKGPSKRSLYS